MHRSGQPHRANAEAPAAPLSLPQVADSSYKETMAKTSSIKHTQLVSKAVDFLRREYGCGVILSEQYCATGEIPDAIGWKGLNRSVVIECKATRSDFLADASKSFRLKPEEGLGRERFYMAPSGVIGLEELPEGWGLLEYA